MQSSVAAEPVRKQLDRILSSAPFVRNERLSRFLRFVVQQALDGKTDEVKESLLGIEVFGRVAGYDTRSDSVVRTEAAKLRVRLTEYYAGEAPRTRSSLSCRKAGIRLYSTRDRRSGKSPRSHQRLLHSVAGNGAGYWPLLLAPRFWPRPLVCGGLPTRARRFRSRSFPWRIPVTIPPTVTSPTA